MKAYKRHKWGRINVNELNKITELYNAKKSIPEISKILSISTGSISEYLQKNKKTRTVAEGNSLKWKDKDFRENQINKRKGNPSGAKGKNWKLKNIRRNINSSGSKNHNWKGGRTKLGFTIRNLPEYSLWRNKVF